MAKTAKINIRVEPSLKTRVKAAADSFKPKWGVSDIVEVALEAFLEKLDAQGELKLSFKASTENDQSNRERVKPESPTATFKSVIRKEDRPDVSPDIKQANFKAATTPAAVAKGRNKSG